MSENIYKEFGRRLQKARADKGLNQQEIASRLGIAQTTYSGYEQGNRKIPLEIIVKLSSALETNSEYLITGAVSQGSFEETDKQKEQLIENYELLNDEGKENLVEYSDTLVFSGKYRRNIKYAQPEMDKEA